MTLTAIAILLLAGQISSVRPFRDLARSEPTSPTTQVDAASNPPATSPEQVAASVPTPVVTLPAPLGGQAAIDALGDHLPEVAAQNGRTAEELTRVLTTDASARIDPTLRLYYVEPALTGAAPSPSTTTPAPSGAASAQAATDPLSLHSRPGSTRVIYLDFLGATVSGTGWNGQPTLGTGASFTNAPFDLDGSPSTFSTTESDVIRSVWARVAEDYATFDVDVTTADPGAAAIDRTDAAEQNFGTKAIITSSSVVAQSCGCGGVAYVGVFDTFAGPSSAAHDFYQPAFVFQQNLGGLSATAKTLGEAASHEAGHTLGLDHDGTAGSAYYAGQGAWAPIMGVSYTRPISQWSRGEYAGANNTQDDLAVIASHGPTVIPDDRGNDRASASAFSNPTTGLITSAADVDWFTFATGGVVGATVSATPATVSPDLDIRLTLYDSNGVVLATSDPPSSLSTADVADGLAASITRDLPGGQYYVSVAGTGAGDPVSTGYSAYASIGSYTLSVSPTTVPACAALPAGALGWWRGESTTGGQVGPTLSGTTAYSAGEVGSGFSAGTTSSLSIAGFPAVTTAMTVEAWIRPNPASGLVESLLNRWGTAGRDATDTFLLLVGPDGGVAWLVDDPSTLWPDPAVGRAPQMVDGAFHHIAATFDHGRLAVYVDGALVASSSSPADSLTTNSSAPFRLLGPGSTGAVIDEPAVYGRALSPAEIASIYLAGSAGKCLG
jgi:hypothetical protein